MEGAEAYRLNVESRGVVVEAATGAGLFRGWMTLRKMLPVECESGCPEGFVLPAVNYDCYLHRFYKARS